MRFKVLFSALTNQYARKYTVHIENKPGWPKFNANFENVRIDSTLFMYLKRSVMYDITGLLTGQDLRIDVQGRNYYISRDDVETDLVMTIKRTK